VVVGQALDDVPVGRKLVGEHDELVALRIDACTSAIAARSSLKMSTVVESATTV